MNSRQTGRMQNIMGAPTAYPRNCWWVGALAEEITRNPLSRWLLDMPVVFYRKEDGGLVALDDRCPHRWAPLSTGEVKGDRIACGYHGFEFGPDGKCKRVPSQDNIPSGAKVHAYPVREIGPLIWIWMGDPARAETIEPPALDFVVDEKFSGSRRWGAKPFNGNYFTLKENVLDLTHFGYVHAKSLGVTDWINPPTVTADEERVTYRQTFIGNPVPKGYGLPIPDSKPINRTGWGQFVTPAVQMSGVDFEDPTPPQGARDAFALRFMHATTPANVHETHYWWLMAEDYRTVTPEESAQIAAFIDIAFSEDKRILEAVEYSIVNDMRGRDTPEITVGADLAAMHARKLLAKWMAAE